MANLRFWQREQSTDPTISLDEFFSMFNQGTLYGLLNQTLTGDALTIAPGMPGIVRGLYKANPVVWAAVDNRQALFSQARFAYRRLVSGRPGDIVGDRAAVFAADGTVDHVADLSILEEPWPRGTTADLLALAEVWVSCAGNFFAVRRGDRLIPLRPDWTGIILGSRNDYDPRVTGQTDDPFASLDVDVVGYVYKPGGAGSGADPITLNADEVVHYMPRPDPEAPWRGMSWISSIVEEVLADREMTQHKRKYLERGGTPNHMVMLPVESPEAYDKWVKKLRQEREGWHGNPYKALYLSKGADAKVLGANLDQIRFDEVQGAGEVRIAVAAGVPPAVLAISAGLDGSALNAGNYEAAYRQFANRTRDRWGNFAASLTPVVEIPSDVMLWYDDRDIPALAEDVKKRADVQQVQAAAINTLITAGYEPDSVVRAIVADDLRLLAHTGMTSVQLSPPGAAAGANGHLVEPAADLRTLLAAKGDD